MIQSLAILIPAQVVPGINAGVKAAIQEREMLPWKLVGKSQELLPVTADSYHRQPEALSFSPTLSF
jgi:hypothetical protein